LPLDAAAVAVTVLAGVTVTVLAGVTVTATAGVTVDGQGTTLPGAGPLDEAGPMVAGVLLNAPDAAPPG